MPCRTCIATRQKKSVDQLLRVVQDPTRPGHLLPDPRRRLPGRGAWITPTPQACAQAEKKRAWGRALRVSGRVDASAITAFIDEATSEQRKTEH
ncbi:YlxR family protein [Corynebacterium uropygiale]